MGPRPMATQPPLIGLSLLMPTRLRPSRILSSASRSPAASSFRIPGMSAARGCWRSSGFQRSRRPALASHGRSGRPDNGIAIDDALAHFRAIAEAIDIPVNADFQGGFAVDPATVRENVTAAVATGVAGLSIEDSTGDASEPAVRVRARGRSHQGGARGDRRHRARASSSLADRKGSLSGVLICARRFAGLSPTPRLAPIACLLRGCGICRTSGRS